MNACHSAAWGVGRESLRFWTTPCGVSRVPWQGGSETGERRQFLGAYHPGGERRHLFGVGEGPTEAAAEARQERIGKTDRRWWESENLDGWPCGIGSISGELMAAAVMDDGSTQAGVRHRMRNNDLLLCYAHASATLRSAS